MSKYLSQNSEKRLLLAAQDRKAFDLQTEQNSQAHLKGHEGLVSEEVLEDPAIVFH